MQSLIFADSHGNINFMLEQIRAHPDISLIIHAGDCEEDALLLREIFPQYTYATVPGNNDWMSREPVEKVEFFGGKKIFITHGHTFSVKTGYDKLARKAREIGADVAVFGHTHIPAMEFVNGVWLVNPGPASRMCALLTVEGDQIRIDMIGKKISTVEKLIKKTAGYCEEKLRE